MAAHAGSYIFGPIRVEYSGNPQRETCRIRLRYDGELFVDEVLSTKHRVSPFSLSLEDDASPVLCGEFRLEGSGGSCAVLLSMRYPGGTIEHFQVWPGDAPPPPPPHPVPPDPEPDSGQALVEAADDEDLFPYVFVRPWPDAGAEEIDNSFLTYAAPDCVGQATTLYCALLAAAKAKQRKQMQDEAIQFLEGAEPYSGQVIKALSDLAAPACRFAQINRELRTHPETSFQGLQEIVTSMTGLTWEAVAEYVRDPAHFDPLVDRLWQNAFAYSVILDYGIAAFEGVTATLATAILLRRVFSVQAPERDLNPWNPKRIHEAASATIILPAQLFPMPAEPGSPSTDAPAQPPASAAAVPYAIGDLEIVRRRLSGYELGEVSHIENVMRGETVEVTRRRTERIRQAWEQAQEQIAESSQNLTGSQDALTRQVNTALTLDFELDFQTNYGPPASTTSQAQQSGYYKMTAGKLPNASLVETAAAFGRSVTSTAATTLRERFASLRSSVTEHESEILQVHKIDGTSFERNQRGVYRWVNKVYEAWVVNYGHRLLLEAMLVNPGQEFIASENALAVRNFSAPPTLTGAGVSCASDIEPYDATKPTFYAKLAAVFGAGQITAPPAPKIVTSGAFQAHTEVSARWVEVPDGYSASTYSVTAAFDAPSDNLAVFGLVGTQGFRIEVTSPNPTSGALASESSRVPVCIASTVTNPSAASSSAPAVYVASVEVTSTVGPRLLADWQMAVYRDLKRAEQDRFAEYRNQTGGGSKAAPAQNAQLVRQTVRGCLQTLLRRKLIEQAQSITGDPQMAREGGAWLEEFLHGAIEWNEMTFRLLDGQDANPLTAFAAQQDWLAAFLQAGFARVVVPVRPQYSFIVPFFLSTGLIWSGANEFTPCVAEAVNLVNELKQVGVQSQNEPVHSLPWRVVVPTGMVILQSDDGLPSFGRR